MKKENDVHIFFILNSFLDFSSEFSCWFVGGGIVFFIVFCLIFLPNTSLFLSFRAYVYVFYYFTKINIQFQNRFNSFHHHPHPHRMSPNILNDYSWIVIIIIIKYQYFFFVFSSRLQSFTNSMFVFVDDDDDDDHNAKYQYTYPIHIWASLVCVCVCFVFFGGHFCTNNSTHTCILNGIRWIVLSEPKKKQFLMFYKHSINRWILFFLLSFLSLGSLS